MNTPQENPTGLILVRGRYEKKIANYSQSRWRQAIKAYLDGIWSQNNDHAEGSIIFDKICLDLQLGEYTILSPSGDKEIPRPAFNRDEIHAVSSDRNNIELGLAKFVVNNYLQQLVIEFGARRLMLWKGAERRDLNICVVNRTF